MAACSDHRRVETEGPCRGALESLSARERAWRRIDQPGIRPVVRDYGPLAYRSGSVQLLGAGYGEHGSAGTLRLAGTEREMAQAAARWRGPLLLCDDGAQGRILRRDQHRIQHRSGWRFLRH